MEQREDGESMMATNIEPKPIKQTIIIDDKTQAYIEIEKTKSKWVTISLYNPDKSNEPFQVYEEKIGFWKRTNKLEELGENILKGVEIDKDVLERRLNHLAIEIEKAKVFEKKTDREHSSQEMRNLILRGCPFSRIHPAIDYVKNDDFFCYGFTYFDYRFDTDDKDRLNPFLITSNKEFIATKSREFNDRRYRLSCEPINEPSRWSYENIEDYLDGKEDINIVSLYKELEEVYRYYIDFGQCEPYYTLNAVYDMLTYVYIVFNEVPYLFFNGRKNSGKSRCATIHSYLGFNAIMSGNLTESSMFRSIQPLKGLVIIDDVENIGYGYSRDEKAKGLRQLSLMGYKKGNYVMRSEQDVDGKFRPMKFNPYSPKIINNQRGLDTTLGSRCIHIFMKPAKTEVANRTVPEDDPRWQKLRNQLYVFGLTHWQEIKTIYNELENVTDLENRDWEIWRPLLSVSLLIDLKTLKDLKINSGDDNKKTNLKDLKVKRLEETNKKNFFNDNIDDKQEIEKINTPSDLLKKFFSFQNSTLLSFKTFKPVTPQLLKIIQENKSKIIIDEGEATLVCVLHNIVIDNTVWNKNGYYSVAKIKEKLKEETDEKWIDNQGVGRKLRDLGFVDSKVMMGEGGRVGTHYKISEEEVIGLAKTMGIELGIPRETSFGKCNLCGKIADRVKTVSGYVCQACRQKEEVIDITKFV